MVDESAPDAAGASTDDVPLSAERTIRLVLQYDGTEFCGWQRQEVGRSVQGVVEAALLPLCHRPTTLHGSGRTDAGVHALGQVAHFVTNRNLSALTFQRALNATLPPDIAIARSDEVTPGFHARFSARRKTYCYQFHQGVCESPFVRRYTHHVWRALDVDTMRRAARELVGTHDFRSFAAEMRDVADTVRTIYALRIRRTKNGVRIHATGNGFLMHMVRTIAGTLLKVGLGALDPSGVRGILEARDRRRAPAALPAQGLFLWKVDY